MVEADPTSCERLKSVGNRGPVSWTHFRVPIGGQVSFEAMGGDLHAVESVFKVPIFLRTHVGLGAVTRGIATM